MLATSRKLKIFSGIELSEDQNIAIDRIYEWRDNWPRTKQYFTFGGLAGSGKSTIVSELLTVWSSVAVVAPTGKAANRLRQLGVDSAQTAHSLIYYPYEDKITSKVKYRKVENLPGVRTIICDEASMVNEWLMNDLLSFGIPILFVGDHGQLEPIGKNPNLMVDPDVKLEKIHRQAEGNPIIRLAAAWREGREQQVTNAVRGKGYWQDKDGLCRVSNRREFDSCLDSGMQLICGYNNTRHKYNSTIRKTRGFSGKLPEPGEKIICLHNNKEFGIFNGQQAMCVATYKPHKKTVEMDIEVDDGRIITVNCLIDQFGANVVEDHKNKAIALFDFAYVLTAHKCQGSQYDSVAVLEEIAPAWNAARWRYTCTTRASKNLVYCM